MSDDHRNRVTLHQILLMLKNLHDKFLFVIIVMLICGTVAFAQTDRALKILKVPEAEYSGEARGRMIEGWIRLRITFLDSGAVGDIFYVNESDSEKNLSKYGLLKNAYEAAKKVEFEPAVKEGKPVTVTKVLQYDFNLGRRGGGFKVERGRP
jgi:hypothetical protein